MEDFENKKSEIYSEQIVTRNLLQYQAAQGSIVITLDQTPKDDKIHRKNTEEQILENKDSCKHEIYKDLISQLEAGYKVNNLKDNEGQMNENKFDFLENPEKMLDHTALTYNQSSKDKFWFTFKKDLEGLHEQNNHLIKECEEHRTKLGDNIVKHPMETFVERMSLRQRNVIDNVTKILDSNMNILPEEIDKHIRFYDILLDKFKGINENSSSHHTQMLENVN